LRGTPQERAQFYHFAITDGWMSRNEARAFEDMNPVDGLDEMLFSVNAAILPAILNTIKQHREGANKQVISSQADSLIKISRIWADFFPQTHRISLFRLFFPPFLALFPVFTEISPTDVSFGPPETGWPG
jgi:hypothetical protein